MKCRLASYQWKLINSCYLCCSLINVDQTLAEKENVSKLQYSHLTSILPFIVLWNNMILSWAVWLTRCIHNCFTVYNHIPTEKNRLTIKASLTFHNYLLHKLMSAFIFCPFTQDICSFPPTVFFFRLYSSKFNTPSFILHGQTFKLQLGHIMLFYFWGMVKCFGSALSLRSMTHTRPLL